MCLLRFMPSGKANHKGAKKIKDYQIILAAEATEKLLLKLWKFLKPFLPRLQKISYG